MGMLKTNAERHGRLLERKKKVGGLEISIGAAGVSVDKAKVVADFLYHVD